MSGDGNPFAGLRAGTPPAELRGRVLAAAHEARGQAAAGAHWIDRAWESRTLRLAWALALALALAGHLAVDLAAHRAARRLSPPTADSENALSSSLWRAPAGLEAAQ